MSMLNYRNPAKNKSNLSGRSISIRRCLLPVAFLMVAMPASSQAINLFPQNDPDAWTRVAIPPGHPVSQTAQWHIDSSKRIIVCDGNGGHEWLRFNREFRNFTFHVKWRFTKLPGSPAYNSGVFFRNNKDGSIWHQAQTALNGGYHYCPVKSRTESVGWS
jgi:hypothetical protein